MLFRSGTPNTGYYVNVDTGWKPSFTGSFSVAWFQKQRAPYTSTAYLFSNIGSFRLFHGGVAYKGLYLRAWGGAPADLILYDPAQTTSVPAFDLIGASAERWVHVAIVVDAAAMRATWYIDGLPLNPSIPITAPASIAATTNMLLCRHTSTGSSYKHDIDEFRFLTRAAQPAEVLAWSRLRMGEAYAYGKGCGGTLSAQAPPALSQPFKMDLTGPAGSVCLVSIGTSRTRLGALALPFDLGLALPYLAGCPWESNLVATLGAATDPAGKGLCVLPIPGDPVLIGMTVFNQGLIVDPASKLSSTNGLGVYINQ
mgnify:CR=1 FL=1